MNESRFMLVIRNIDTYIHYKIHQSYNSIRNFGFTLSHTNEDDGHCE
jgi:hypothetical protein